MDKDVVDLLQNIDWKNAEEVECEKCQCPLFKNTFGIRKVSSADSPNGQELIIPIRVFACDKCGYVDEKLQVTGIPGQ
tara:strand:+ start:597 stop:830 length:234 start_codon:yes stop_codon:yes gene_type:complete